MVGLDYFSFEEPPECAVFGISFKVFAYSFYRPAMNAVYTDSVVILPDNLYLVAIRYVIAVLL